MNVLIVPAHAFAAAVLDAPHGELVVCAPASCVAFARANGVELFESRPVDPRWIQDPNELRTLRRKKRAIAKRKRKAP